MIEREMWKSGDDMAGIEKSYSETTTRPVSSEKTFRWIACFRALRVNLFCILLGSPFFRQALGSARGALTQAAHHIDCRDHHASSCKSTLQGAATKPTRSNVGSPLRAALIEDAVYNKITRKRQAALETGAERGRGRAKGEGGSLLSRRPRRSP